MPSFVKPSTIAAGALAAAAILICGSRATPADGGWKVLFDGHSTDAFRGYTLDTFPSACWTIQDGTLKTVAGAKGPCDLMTKDKYRDFELELEYKLAARGNSGVLYRVVEVPGEPSWHSGPEMQILDDPTYPESHPQNAAGALYDLIPAKDKVVHPAGEWNKVRVLVRGNHVEHWLNGKKVVEYELGTDELKKMIAGSKFKDMPRFANAPEGYVVLQHHDGGDVWFRNVRIRALSSTSSDATGAAGSWVSLFNGKDLTGWKPYGQEKWTVDDGEIHGVAVTKEYGYLGTEKTYRDFEMKAMFKAEGTGNSGIFYHSSIDGVDITGVQVEVDPHPGMHTGGLYETGGRQWVTFPSPEAEAALHVGDWNEVRAVVRGPHVQTWVNGVVAVDYTDPKPKFTDGIIALQLHAGGEGRMRFKDISIRELP
jgi:3-keto-disaccharide hydrolase